MALYLPTTGHAGQAIGRDGSNAIVGVASGLEVVGGNWWERPPKPDKGGSRMNVPVGRG